MPGNHVFELWSSPQVTVFTIKPKTPERNGRTTTFVCDPVMVLALCLLCVFAVPFAAEGQTDESLASPVVVFERHSADPRALSTYLAVVDWESPFLSTHVAKVGVGDGFTLARGRPGAMDVEVGIDFVVHAQFDADARSFDFLNADFIVGIPLATRFGPWSAETRLGHWSAHLGDEFLLRSDAERQETSVEFLELLLARDVGPFRLVAGGERRFRTVPGTIPADLVRVGGDIRPDRVVDLGPIGDARLTFGTDLRWDEATRGTPAYSVQAGFEVTPRGTEPGHRVWAVQFELYDGPSPFGQFFLEPLRTVGVSLRLR